MTLLPAFVAACSCLLPLFSPVRANEPEVEEKKAAPKTVEALAKELRDAIVVITTKGRETRSDTVGTGFVVDAGGLIATNLHVIGQGRLITVELADGRRFDVKTVHATDRARDLALIKIDAKKLATLPVGNSDELKDGQAIVAIGNPQGLNHCIVAGVVSGRRPIDGLSMIQLAIPLEPGNSGGPLIDMQGRVQGIITLKSLLTENLGFAVPVNALKPMLEKPNPISMNNWVTIGALDPDEWKVMMGAAWSQRAGRIRVEGSGTGFGGRSICVFQPRPPDLPYEVSVDVKLNSEAGAAGLIFRHDGDRHYGFYPTGGKLRLTRFDGPDVFSWTILKDFDAPAYRKGDWNTLKVRITKQGCQCFVNNQLVIESTDAAWSTGQPGLAKFRDTIAEFKNFQVASKIDDAVDRNAAAKVLKLIEGQAADKSIPSELIAKLTALKGTGSVLKEKARELDRQANRLREIAATVHQQRIYKDLATHLEKKEKDVDLIYAALLLARLDNEEVDVEGYCAEFNRMTKKLIALVDKKADDSAKIATLNKFFFEQRGFHGSRSDYYTRSNSYLNEVIDDREGLPITLCLLYMEMGRKIGLDLVGIAMPGHFVVRHMPEKGEGPFIDVYENGKTFTLDEARQRLEDRGLEFRDELIKPASKKAIIVRMLHNLLNVARQQNDMDSGLRYLEGIVTLEPASHEERFMRSMLLYNKGLRKEALQDVVFLLDHYPDDSPEKKRLLKLKTMIEKEMSTE